MTEDEEDTSIRAIETVRGIFRGAAERMEARGVRLEDVSIGLAYACADVAARYKGGHHEAIEWLRTCHDLQERQLLDQDRRRHAGE